MINTTFALRIFPVFISLPQRIYWYKTSEATPRKDWKWVLTTNANEMGGEGAETSSLFLLLSF